MTLASQLKQFATFLAEQTKIEAQNSTIGQRLILGFSGLVMWLVGGGVGWFGVELQGAGDLSTKLLGAAWIGLFVSLVLFGSAVLWIALYPIPRSTWRWLRIAVGIGLFLLVWFVTAPLASGQNCRGGGDWQCIAAALFTAFAILVGTLLVTNNKHHHGRR